MQTTYELCMVAKTFVNPMLTFYCLKLFGCLLMHLNYLKGAVSTFETMRDFSYEFMNWSFMMQSFDLLARALQKQSNHDGAIITYKKMLQLAWVTESMDFEVRAYMGLA